jgi:hypothetical protein
MDKEALYRKFPYAELKSTDGKACLRIYTYAYEYPDADDGGDSDWYLNYIELSCYGFSVKIDEPVFEGRVLENWHKDIEAFQHSHKKHVELHATEPEISFTLTHDKINRNVHVKGDVINAKTNTYRSYLQFEFYVDNDSINSFNEGITELLRAFPPRYR